MLDGPQAEHNRALNIYARPLPTGTTNQKSLSGSTIASQAAGTRLSASPIMVQAPSSETVTHGRGVLTPVQRRRSQNRRSQHAFRTKQKAHMQYLEEKVQDLTNRHSELEREYSILDTKYRALLEKMENKEAFSYENITVWSSKECYASDSESSWFSFFAPEKQSVSSPGVSS